MKAFLDGVGEFFKNLAKSLRELADSRRAVLAGLAVIAHVVAVLLPQYSKTFDELLPAVDVILAALAALLTIQPGSTETIPSTTITASSGTAKVTIAPSDTAKG